MSLFFRPDIKIESIYELNGEILSELGIKVLISDLDNTMATYLDETPDDKIHNWVKDLKEHGISLVVVSNNGKERVEKYCEPLGILYYWKSRKPSRKTIRIVMEKHGVTKESTALVGDKITTDIIGAKRSGVLAIKVPPLGKRRLFE